MKKYWPIFLILIITPFSAQLDLALTRFFYDLNSVPEKHFLTHPFLDVVFNYASIPALLLACTAAAIFILSYFLSSLKQWRPMCLCLALTLAIGSGLIVHAMLKDHWGRPRPKQVIEFGGSQQFRPYYKPNFFHQPQPSKSFPCGHCTTGFYFFALALIGKRLNSPWLIYSGFALAFILGTLLSVTRLIQGGHFLTDVLFSGLIMWYTAVIVDYYVFQRWGQKWERA